MEKLKEVEISKKYVDESIQQSGEGWSSNKSAPIIEKI
jgi:hypothetical protein